MEFGRHIIRLEWGLVAGAVVQATPWILWRSADTTEMFHHHQPPVRWRGNLLKLGLEIPWNSNSNRWTCSVVAGRKPCRTRASVDQDACYHGYVTGKFRCRIDNRYLL